MVGALQRVVVCSPRAAGWSRPEHVARWRELGFHHAPNFTAAQAQHETLCRELQNAGAELIELPPADHLSLDAVYAHDATTLKLWAPTARAVKVREPMSKTCCPQIHSSGAS